MSEKEIEVDELVIGIEDSGFEFQDILDNVTMSSKEIETEIEKSPNCINIRSKWYFVEETSLISLFMSVLQKIKEKNIDILCIKHT